MTGARKYLQLIGHKAEFPKKKGTGPQFPSEGILQDLVNQLGAYEVLHG